KRLVPHELVIIAQALFIQDIGAAEDNSVFKRAALGEPELLELLKIAQKTECPGARDFLLEGAVAQVVAAVLLADPRIIEVDIERDGNIVRRRKNRPRGAVGNLDFLQNLDIAARRLLFDDIGALDQKYERRRRAVHHRNFRPVKL